MKDTVILSWNFTNWVTVILMVTLGFVIFRTIHNVIQKRMAAA